MKKKNYNIKENPCQKYEKNGQEKKMHEVSLSEMKPHTYYKLRNNWYDDTLCRSGDLAYNVAATVGFPVGHVCRVYSLPESDIYSM